MKIGFQAQPDGIPIIIKGPDEKLDYPVDFAASAPIGPWLADGETIVSDSVTAETGITVDSTSLYPTLTPTMVIVWLRGGALGGTYTVTAIITTSAGRIAERSFRVRVVPR